MDNPLNNQRTNPRFKRTFPLTLNLEQVTVHGHAVEPSAYGCNVEINEYEYNQLISNPALWKNNRRIIVSTTINELPAQINNLKISDDFKYLISLKLCDDRTWYN